MYYRKTQIVGTWEPRNWRVREELKGNRKGDRWREKKSKRDRDFLFCSLLFLLLWVSFSSFSVSFSSSWVDLRGQGSHFTMKSLWVDSVGEEAPPFVLSWCDTIMKLMLTKKCKRLTEEDVPKASNYQNISM